MEKPTLEAAKVDGNAFFVIGAVSKALKKEGQSDKAEEFTNKAFDCGSYDELLRLTYNYVEWV